MRDEFSWHRSTDFATVAAEARAVRAGVGLMGELNRATLSYDLVEPDAPRSVIVMFDTSCPAAGLRLLTVGLGMSAFQRVSTVFRVGQFDPQTNASIMVAGP